MPRISVECPGFPGRSHAAVRKAPRRLFRPAPVSIHTAGSDPCLSRARSYRTVRLYVEPTDGHLPNGGEPMSLRINAEAPNFTAETTQGTINFHDWIGDGWAILFSHPKDFTPVCTTELGYMAGLKPEFDKRNTKIIGLSVDPVGNHAKWAQGHRGDPGPRGQLPDDRRSRAQGGDGLRHAARRRRHHVRRPHRRRQRHRALGVRHRPGQEDQGDADLSDEHRPQLRRGAAAARFLPADGEAHGRDAGELEARRGRDHPARGLRRAGQGEVSRTAGRR